MSLAERIEPTLAARARRAAALEAGRREHDAYVLAQMVLLQERFDTLLRLALGLHSAVAIVRDDRILPVAGRSFATLPVGIWTTRATFNGAPQSVVFTPGLDFSAPGQFGRIACEIDFDYLPRRGRADRVARALLETGVLMRGAGSASLVLPLAGTPVELGSGDLEAAYAAWWLR